MIIDVGLEASAALLINQCRARHLRVATAESCTGGLIAALITSIAGSSDVFDAGFVAYSNAAKTRLIGVPASLIERVGAVSDEVARSMAEGALAHSDADIAVAVTGIAGPGGGSETKPVGLVHCAAARRGQETVHEELRLGEIGRSEVRMVTAAHAVDMLYRLATSTP